MDQPHTHNEKAWDERAARRMRFTRPATEAELKDPLKAIDPWVRDEGVAGKRLLCLAAGGGRQGPLYAAAGAEVTVVDISHQQLELDKQVGAEHGLRLSTHAASMDNLAGLADHGFDIVIHPVSSCYVPDLGPVYREVARVTRPGGLYVSQHKQPVSMITRTRPTFRGYEVTEPYYRQGPLPEVTGSLHREAGTQEFLHRWDQLIGLMCKAGLTLEGLSEPRHGDPAAKAGSFEHRSHYIAPYVRIKARAPDGGRDPSPKILQP